MMELLLTVDVNRINKLHQLGAVIKVNRLEMMHRISSQLKMLTPKACMFDILLFVAMLKYD